MEGISEQILIPVLYQRDTASGEPMEQHGCDILNVNGVSFRHFLKVIKNGYFLKCLVLTDQDTHTAVEKRADKLKSDFDDNIIISIKITKNSTFEKDIIEANSNGSGKRLLLDALKDTKPDNGIKFEKAFSDRPINVDLFFAEIEQYKAEFAFNLMNCLTNSSVELQIPEYIKQGFAFLRGTHEIAEA